MNVERGPSIILKEKENQKQMQSGQRKSQHMTYAYVTTKKAGLYGSLQFSHFTLRHDRFGQISTRTGRQFLKFASGKCTRAQAARDEYWHGQSWRRREREDLFGIGENFELSLGNASLLHRCILVGSSNAQGKVEEEEDLSWEKEEEEKKKVVSVGRRRFVHPD